MEKSNKDDRFQAQIKKLEVEIKELQNQLLDYKEIKKHNEELEHELIRKNDENSLLMTQLIMSQDRLCETQTIAAIGNWEWNILNKNFYWSEQIYKLLGLPENDNLTIESFSKQIHKSDVAQLFRHISASIHQKKTSPINLRVIKKNTNTEIILKFQTEAYYNSENKLFKLIGVVQDITDQAITQKQLSENEMKFRTLAQIAPVGIVTTNAEGKVNFVNQQFCEITGISEADLHHNQNNKIQIKHWILELSFRNENLSDNGKPLEINYINETTNKEKWLHIFSRKQYTNDNDILRYVAVIVDITDQKKAKMQLLENEYALKMKNVEYQLLNNKLKQSFFRLQNMNEELQLAKDKAEESNRLKTAFLANLSHEIRTPMNGIIGFAEMLNNKDLDKERRIKYTNIISKSSTQLLHIVNDIIEVSKIEAGKITLNESFTSINTLMEEVFTFLEPFVNTSKIEFKPIYRKDFDILLFVDSTKLKQVLNYLLSNAIKFTEKGHIFCRYKVEDKNVIFSVEDTGIGIDKIHHEIIFEYFRQVENDYTTTSGNGLGLAISKTYISKMGGQIWVNSEPENGAVFNFSLPLKV